MGLQADDQWTREGRCVEDPAKFRRICPREKKEGDKIQTLNIPAEIIFSLSLKKKKKGGHDYNSIFVWVCRGKRVKLFFQFFPLTYVHVWLAIEFQDVHTVKCWLIISLHPSLLSREENFRLQKWPIDQEESKRERGVKGNEKFHSKPLVSTSMAIHTITLNLLYNLREEFSYGAPLVLSSCWSR